MTDAAELLGRIDERTLIDHVSQQRWYASKTRELAHVRVLDAAVVRTTEPLLVCALLEVRFHEGTHDTYQLLVGFRQEGWSDGVIAEVDGWTAYDAFADPALSRALVHAMRGGTTVQGREGTIEFRPVAGFAALGTELQTATPIPTEQSNSSVVFDRELILKSFRRVEPGINPELELLRFLTERGFHNIAALGGWYAYTGAPLDATLGILQEFVSDGRDGWELAFDELQENPEGFLERLHRLGEVTGTMHSLLASDATDPTFSPETPSEESLGLLTATIDEEIERVFLTLPDDESVAPIAGRGEEVREQLRLLTHVGSTGRVIRTHGDFHLGQTLWTGEDWVLLDFEGVPARSLPERRRKRSPLRDVAGMLRSFGYVVSAAEILRGIVAPGGWEQRAREQFLAGYRATVDQALLPAGEQTVEKLLAVFELEKAVYELRYELDNRPEWVKIPVAGIARLIEATTAA